MLGAKDERGVACHHLKDAREFFEEAFKYKWGAQC